MVLQPVMRFYGKFEVKMGKSRSRHKEKTHDRNHERIEQTGAYLNYLLCSGVNLINSESCSYTVTRLSGIEIGFPPAWWKRKKP